MTPNATPPPVITNLNANMQIQNFVHDYNRHGRVWGTVLCGKSTTAKCVKICGLQTRIFDLHVSEKNLNSEYGRHNEADRSPE
jgi:hypothetical protein